LRLDTILHTYDASVETDLVTVDVRRPEPALIDAAARVIRAGGLVAFPTETVYGLGANALDGQALARIFVAKERPTSDPIIAHIAEAEDLSRLVDGIPEVAHQLAERFWPGPLTLILRRHPSVPDLIAKGRDTVAVRMPAHPVARALITAAGVPIGAPSANRFTRPSATRAAHVVTDLAGRIDMILDGGAARIGVESTVLDLTGSVPTVLRPGGVTLEALQAERVDVVFRPAYASEGQGHQSPGQMLKHYSPRARVRLFRGEQRPALEAMQALAQEETERGRSVVALLTREDADTGLFAGIIERLGAEDDPEAQAHGLFAALRDLDEREAEVILVRDPAQAGLGRALADRLLRAAVGEVIEC